jgi:hypothetical protein
VLTSAQCDPGHHNLTTQAASPAKNFYPTPSAGSRSSVSPQSAFEDSFTRTPSHAPTTIAHAGKRFSPCSTPAASLSPSDFVSSGNAVLTSVEERRLALLKQQKEIDAELALLNTPQLPCIAHGHSSQSSSYDPFADMPYMPLQGFDPELFQLAEIEMDASQWLDGSNFHPLSYAQQPASFVQSGSQPVMADWALSPASSQQSTPQTTSGGAAQVNSDDFNLERYIQVSQAGVGTDYGRPEGTASHQRLRSTMSSSEDQFAQSLNQFEDFVLFPQSPTIHAINTDFLAQSPQSLRPSTRAQDSQQLSRGESPPRDPWEKPEMTFVDPDLIPHLQSGISSARSFSPTSSQASPLAGSFYATPTRDATTKVDAHQLSSGPYTPRDISEQSSNTSSAITDGLDRSRNSPTNSLLSRLPVPLLSTEAPSSESVTSQGATEILTTSDSRAYNNAVPSLRRTHNINSRAALLTSGGIESSSQKELYDHVLQVPDAAAVLALQSRLHSVAASTISHQYSSLSSPTSDGDAVGGTTWAAMLIDKNLGVQPRSRLSTSSYTSLSRDLTKPIAIDIASGLVRDRTQPLMALGHSLEGNVGTTISVARPSTGLSFHRSTNVTAVTPTAPGIETNSSMTTHPSWEQRTVLLEHTNGTKQSNSSVCIIIIAVVIIANKSQSNQPLAVITAFVTIMIALLSLVLASNLTSAPTSIFAVIAIFVSVRNICAYDLHLTILPSRPQCSPSGNPHLKLNQLTTPRILWQMSPQKIPLSRASL